MVTHRSGRTAAVLGAAAIVLAGCFTGERPSFEDEEGSAALVSTGSDDIDLVLDRLESTDGATFTADYETELHYGGVSATASVVQTDDDLLVVTVATPTATTQFTSSADGDETCNVLTNECEAELNEARISDVALRHDFFGQAFADRLRSSASRRIGDSASYTKPIAGEDARCVDVVVSGGTETFCALDSGVLAQFVGADMSIDLTDYSPEVDPTRL
ncbi:hypothetical protein [Ilumatobacter coccineus]|jgi:hypothetical protein|uniref:Lipoprotein n=1 Tax=Ilumatobacter coccineus (strain NBRC 103263 / KCTC 29153 / YM16-304) TaxID=1313172 RepID=A0A6C7E5J1_ILUCY|nr:hypothetical protein [Ilumatobacter coccineus]BAN01821.1 hypothetical protein YM304_15070 [Ilumatobacter coccineus YM16-304]